MDPQTSQQTLIHDTITQILKTSNLDSVTEKHVRDLAADKLKLDLSDLPHKILIRQIIDSFLLRQDEEIHIKPVVSDSCRLICKLSQKRDVAVRSSAEKTVVLIRDFLLKDGKQLFTSKGISLPTDQWSTFHKSIPDIEEAITKLESRQSVCRPQVEKNQADANKTENVRQQNGVRQVMAEPMQQPDTHHNYQFIDTGSRVNHELSLSTSQKLVPIGIVRFDGKNYKQWVDPMESYLNNLKVAYVLSDPCPSAARIAGWEIAKTLSGIDKWIDDDRICRQNILNTLCDNIYSHYSKKTGSARDLWEELKLIYLNEEHGVNVSLVKKYLEFQIVEEKSIFDQAQELHLLADSIIASGMHVEEKFHVNAIISKLPASWKPFSIDLMKEDYVPVWMLMNELKAEEESLQSGNTNEARYPRHSSPSYHPTRKLGPQRIPMKKPGNHMGIHEANRERNVKFCNLCKRKGHFPEQCWFRDSSFKDIKVETDNVVDGGVKDGAADRSTT